MKLALSSRHKSDACKLANKGEQISSKNYPISIGRQAQSSELSVATEVGFDKVGSVTHPEETSRKRQLIFGSNKICRNPGAWFNSQWVLTAAHFSVVHQTLVTELEDALAASVFRKRQTTAQSSVFDVGYRVLHARWADSTRNRAAEACEGALLMMLTTSALESTSHTYRQQRDPDDHISKISLALNK